MTRVDFYVLEQCNERQHALFVCRLTEKAFREGHQIHIHCDGESTAEDLDGLLWTYRDTAFLPHARYDSEEAKDTPIIVASGAEEPRTNDILINLAPAIPEYFSRFDRVMETTGSNDTERASARARYRFYQERGYTLNTHKLDAINGG